MAPGKPEAALAKAKELINVGKPNSAIEILSECMKAQKKQKAWIKTHEEVMMLLAELCVDTKKSLQFKEIIHQYKNMTFQMNPKSLEDVVKHYLSLARTRTEEARERSKQLVPAEIEDLDNPDTPENLILSSVHPEGEQERQDRAVLTPWLKFLWESYRQCMELLRNNVKFERLYHDIAHDSFEFCQRFDRKSEFRKLSEILRNHMSKFQSLAGALGAGALNNPQSSPDTWLLHLETRLRMLDYALRFELYNEAFKAVEDVWNLLNSSNISAKPRILANYYTKTAQVFFESGSSYLFHAAALHKLFFYSRDNKKNISVSELEQLALQLVLATIAVPLPINRDPIDPLLESGEIQNPVKQKTLSMLLNLPSPPTRASLIRDIQSNHVHDLIDRRIANFFLLLEFDYKPLTLAREAPVILGWLAEQSPEYRVYLDLIQQAIIGRILLQIGAVYKTILVSEFEKLCGFIDPLRLQSIVIDLIRNLELPVRIDHRAGVLKFDVYTDLGLSQRSIDYYSVSNCGAGGGSGGDNDKLSAAGNSANSTIQISQQINGLSTLARQLSRFSVAIYDVARFVGFVDQQARDNREWIRTSYQRKLAESHRAMLARKGLIESRKEEIERWEEENQRRMSEQQRLAEDKKRREETKRLHDEAEQLEKRRMAEQLEQHQKKMIRAKITYLKSSDAGNQVLKNFTEKELEEMDEIRLVKMQCDEKNRLREEEEERMKRLEQKIDYFQRAVRLEEISRLDRLQLDQFDKNKLVFEQAEARRRDEARLEFELRREQRTWCEQFQAEIEAYRSKIIEQMNAENEAAERQWKQERDLKEAEWRERRTRELQAELALQQQQQQQEVMVSSAPPAPVAPIIEQAAPSASKKSTYVPPHLRKQQQQQAPPAPAPQQQPPQIASRSAPASAPAESDASSWRTARSTATADANSHEWKTSTRK